MTRKGKEFLYESFEDRKMAILVGFLCLVYFFVSYLPDFGGVAKILPSWPLPLFGIIALITLIGQAIVWKLFRHFEVKWYRYTAGWILFFCEFGLILFTVTFATWPAYLFYAFLTTPQTHG